MGGPHTIVIADDDPDILQLVEGALSVGDGYSVVAAADGDEAWRAIQTHRPRTVVLDVEMPGRTGLELAQAIKADASLVETRVILLTARSRPSDLEAGFVAGADFYLTKPFSLVELLETVRLATQRA
jgi:DNA-binding response OmpR family regulator